MLVTTNPRRVAFVVSIKWRERTPFGGRDLGHIAAQRDEVPRTDEDTVLVGVSREGFDEQGRGLDAALVPESLLKACAEVAAKYLEPRDKITLIERGVIFRVSEPLFQLPPEVKVGAYQVYPTVIDLAASQERGRDPARSGLVIFTEEAIHTRVRGARTRAQVPER
jgi:hypothetical protein